MFLANENIRHRALTRDLGKSSLNVVAIVYKIELKEYVEDKNRDRVQDLERRGSGKNKTMRGDEEIPSTSNSTALRSSSETPNCTRRALEALQYGQYDLENMAITRVHN